jgi:hypothetical protein
MQIIFTHESKVLRVFGNVPESYTLDDFRRDLSILSREVEGPIRASLTESTQDFIALRVAGQGV